MAIFMHFLIFLPLIFCILPNHGFIPLLATYAGILSIGPKFSSPSVFHHVGTRCQYLSSREALYHCYYLCHAICRNRLYQEMQMILVGTNIEKHHMISLFNFQNKYLSEHHKRSYQLPLAYTQLDIPNEMVDQYCYIMTLV